MRHLPTALIAILFCCSPAFGAVESSYEAMVLAEIAHHRQLELEEKKMEVLARLEQMDAPQIDVTAINSSSSRAYNRTKTNLTANLTTEVSE